MCDWAHPADEAGLLSQVHAVEVHVSVVDVRTREGERGIFNIKKCIFQNEPV